MIFNQAFLYIFFRFFASFFSTIVAIFIQAFISRNVLLLAISHCFQRPIICTSFIIIKLSMFFSLLEVWSIWKAFFYLALDGSWSKGLVLVSKKGQFISRHWKILFVCLLIPCQGSINSIRSSSFNILSTFAKEAR